MKNYAGLLLLAALLCFCKLRQEKAAGEAEGPSVPAALAVLEAGENPLWFELAEAGPRQIAFPDEAGLSPFAPWPLARHIRFILPLGEELILGVNREGFLRFAPWDMGRTVLYRSGDAARWGPYTLAALFPFEGRAAALLYRDDFFIDSPAPLPWPRTFSLDPDSPEPRPLEIPAFGDFPSAEGWDLEALRFTPGGQWYYRAVRKTEAQPEIVYYRTGDLDFQGEAVSITAFQNSALPEPVSVAPPLLRSVLEAAFALGTGGLATVVSPGFPGPRYFTGGGPDGAGAAEGGTEAAAGLSLAGFYREPAAGPPGIALLVLPNGRGFFHGEALPAETAGPVPETAASTSPVSAAAPRPLILPALPPGFVYTAAALCGNTLIAAWEEQEGYSIGAAGFMALRLAAE
jgi:hypothetical protein